MNCKTALYAANTTPQNVLATGTTINFGSIVRRFGCGLNLSGGNVEIRGAGYYDVDANLTLVPSAAGVAAVQLYKDGVIVPGAEATLTVIAGDSYAVTIPAIIRETCNCTSTITAVITGVTGAINNAAIVVEKI